MTVQLPPAEIGAPGPTIGDPPAIAKPGRARLIALWTVAVVTAALVAAWLFAGLNPSLPHTGLAWQSPAFVEQSQVGGADDQEATLTVWDHESVAWASVVLHNPRPYPVTVSPAPVGNVVEVQVAAYDYPEQGGLISPEYVTPVPILEVPSGGFVVVLLHVSDRCVEMMAGGATGIDSARVDVTSLGLTRTIDVPFGATYMAGTTIGHAADPSCPTE